MKRRRRQDNVISINEYRSPQVKPENWTEEEKEMVYLFLVAQAHIFFQLNLNEINPLRQAG